jgi:stage IV sporulation protein FB
MLFALIHELGHMAAGIFLKLKPKTLHFMPFGIRITFEAYGYRKLFEKKKVIVAMGGPLTNLIICILTVFFNINTEIKELIIYSNILIATFNLIPIYPLDGGRILKGLIRLKYKEIECDKIINKISNIVMIILTAASSVGILYFKNIAMVLVLIYLWIIVANENKKYYLKMNFYNAIQKTNKYIDI